MFWNVFSFSQLQTQEIWMFSYENKSQALVSECLEGMDQISLWVKLFTVACNCLNITVRMTPTLSSSFLSYSKQFSDGKIDQFSGCLLKSKNRFRLPFFTTTPPMVDFNLQGSHALSLSESGFGSSCLCRVDNTDGVSVAVAVSQEPWKGQCWHPAFVPFHLIPAVVLA